MFKQIIRLVAVSSFSFLAACGGDGEGTAQTTAGTYTGTITATFGSDTLTGPVVLTVTGANTVTGTVTLGTVPSSGLAYLLNVSGTVDGSGKVTAKGSAGSPPQDLMSIAANVDVAKGVMAGTYSLTLGSPAATGVFSLVK